MSDNEPMWRRYRDLLSRRPHDDADEEVRHHLELRRQEALRAGLDPQRAAAAARERFGDVDGVLAELRSIDRSRERRQRRADWLADLAQDARFAVRSLGRAPAFAIAAVATLSLAIAANATIFSFVNALLLEPLPFRRPQELVRVSGQMLGSVGELLALRERTTAFSELGLYRARSVTLNDDRDAVRLDGAAISPNLIALLGVSPAIGAGFTEESGRRGAGGTILLSHSLWTTRYGGDPAVAGKTVMVDGASFTVAGVMPPSFQFPSTTTRFWVPITIDPSNATATWAIAGGGIVGRLKPGVGVDRAADELKRVLPGMRRLNPIWDQGDGYGSNAAAVPLQQSLIANERPTLTLLFGCVIVVLLVACVNLANLMLARVTAREREFSVRAALGGGRSRLIRQLLTESVVIAAVGGLLGLALAVVGLRWATSALPPTMARTADIRLSTSVLAFTAGLTILTGVAFGLLPAFRAAAVGAGRRTATLGRAFGVSRDQHRLSATLIVGEIALAVLLAITAGLLTRSFAELRSLSPGFRTEHVTAARLSPPAAAYRERARTTAFYQTLAGRLRALPEVSSVGLVDRLPIAGPVYGMGMRVQGQFEDGTQLLPAADHVQIVTPDYLRAMSIPILGGRALTDDDREGAVPVALVSQSLARRFWPNGDALGKRIGYPMESPWLTIVGVVPDVKLDSLRDTSAVAVYVPFAVPVSAVRTMDDVLAQSVAKPRFTTMLVGGFALAALLLGATGIFGVTSYVVSQRAHEMSVRVALGATSRDILALVMGRAAVLAFLGAAIGCAAAVAATRGLGALLYGVSPTDPVTFAAAALLFVAVAVAASFGPARRATRADPVQTLRNS